MIKKDCIIVDLDGTLCDIKHRLRYVEHKPKNYNAFEKACVYDHVIKPVAMVVWALMEKYEFDIQILFVSGRSDKVSKETIEWLGNQGWCASIIDDIITKNLYMRKSGDYRPDNIVKKEILDEIQKDYNVLFAIDDRDSVVDMWKDNGIFVFNVKQTKKEY